jgi:plastocyanin
LTSGQLSLASLSSGAMSRPGKKGRRVVAAVVTAALSSFALATGAWAAAQPIVAGDDFYSAAVFTMDQGDQPVLQNTGVSTHNVTASALGPDGRPLFLTPDIGNGAATLEGTQYLTAGTYAFYCTIHPLTMSGDLQVSGNGAPVARPRIDVIASKGKIGKVAKKGKLPVKVRGLTASRGIVLKLKLGKKVLGTRKAFDLAAGQTRKLSVKLKKSGKSTLAKKRKATVKVTGTVPFGAPDTAKARLR